MADKTIAQEIEEFRLSITEYDKTDFLASASRCAREGMDVLGKIVALENNPAAVDELATAIGSGMNQFIDKALADRPLMKRGAKMALPLIVPELIEQGAKYIGKTDEFIEAHILPFFVEGEKFCHAGRVAFGG